jgi:hypothetical protein
MCSNPFPVPLATTEAMCISWCKQCRKFTLHKEEVSFHFCKPAFLRFLHVLGCLQDEHYQYFIADEPKVWIKKHNGEGMFLSAPEVESLKALIQEALLLQEARQILTSSRDSSL